MPRGKRTVDYSKVKLNMTPHKLLFGEDGTVQSSEVDNSDLLAQIPEATASDPVVEPKPVASEIVPKVEQIEIMPVKKDVISPELRRELEDLLAEDRMSFSWVLQRSKGISKDEATKNLDLSKPWFYRKSKEQQERLEQLANRLYGEPRLTAELILQAGLIRAAEVKVEGLDAKSEKVQQEVATEILDRFMPVAQRSKYAMPDGQTMQVILYMPDNGKKAKLGDGQSYEVKSG